MKNIEISNFGDSSVLSPEQIDGQKLQGNEFHIQDKTIVIRMLQGSLIRSLIKNSYKKVITTEIMNHCTKVTDSR